jgi:hypothetical protein
LCNFPFHETRGREDLHVRTGCWSSTHSGLQEQIGAKEITPCSNVVLRPQSPRDRRWIAQPVTARWMLPDRGFCQSL